MALDLKLIIEADASQAKRELAAVESGIKKVEGAAKSTQDPISKVTSNIDGLATSQTKLSTSADLSAEALHAETMALIKGDAAAINAAKSTGTLTTASVTARTAILGTTAATIGLVTAYGGLALFLRESILEYGKQTGALDGVTTAVGKFGGAWNKFEAEVGKRLLGGGGILSGIETGIDNITASLEEMTPALADAFMVATGLDSFIAKTEKAAIQWRELSAWIRLSRTDIEMIDAGMLNPLISAPRGYGQSAPLRIPNPTLGEREDSWRLMRPVSPTSSTRSGRQSNGPSWSAPGVTLGVPGWGTSWIDPLSAAGSIPLPYMWNGATPSVTSGLGGWMPGTSVAIGGFNRPGPGLWGQGGGFQDAVGQAAYYGGYGPSASAGSQIRAGIKQGGFGGYAAAGMGAIQAGQEIWASTAEGGAGKRALSGAMSGAAAGTMILPGIGTAIGAGVGALVGAVRGWLAPTEYDKRMGQLGQDRTAATGLLNQPGLERQWNAMGGNVPFSYDFLKTQAFHDPTAVKGYLDDMLTKTDKLNAAMERYGITWEELGDKAQQSHIDGMAQQLIEDFEVLTLAGADVTFVIEKMGGAVEDFVQSALRTGSEVPTGMQPMIEKMIEMGLLTDENGEVFKDLESTGLTFAKTMTQGFDSISKAIEHLAQALGYVPSQLDAITDAAGRTASAVGSIPNAPGGYQESQGGDPNNQTQYHNGGYVWPRFHRGGEVPAILQTGEFVMSRSAVNRIGAGNLAAMNRMGGTAGETGVYLDGRLVGRYIVKHLANDVKRRGLA